MTVSGLLAHKFKRMFRVLDLNRDGVVDRRDLVARVDAFARLRGWAADSDAYRRNLEVALDEWQNLRESVDLDEDGGVTEAEFLGYAEIYLTDRESVRAYARGDAQLLMDAMDTDGDGRITEAEYREYLRVCGEDPSGAAVFFAHADLDEDGHLTRAERIHAVEEFLLSEDPAAGGNYLFGKLDE